MNDLNTILEDASKSFKAGMLRAAEIAELQYPIISLALREKMDKGYYPEELIGYNKARLRIAGLIRHYAEKGAHECIGQCFKIKEKP